MRIQVEVCFPITEEWNEDTFVSDVLRGINSAVESSFHALSWNYPGGYVCEVSLNNYEILKRPAINKVGSWPNMSIRQYVEENYLGRQMDIPLRWVLTP